MVYQLNYQALWIKWRGLGYSIDMQQKYYNHIIHHFSTVKDSVLTLISAGQTNTPMLKFLMIYIAF